LDGIPIHLSMIGVLLFVIQDQEQQEQRKCLLWLPILTLPFPAIVSPADKATAVRAAMRAANILRIGGPRR
jgi:hypothetical protein